MPQRSNPFAFRASIALGGAFALAGCTTTVVQPANPFEPSHAYLVDHGRTSSIVIPASSGGMLRYAYGDWNYYALRRTDLLHGVAALLWPTRSGLGRDELDAPASIDSVQRQVTSWHSIQAVRVESARVLAFEHRMEALYASRRDSEVENRVYGMSFVHHPRPYTYFWNSNHAVASWLRELGCETRGVAFAASWRIE